MKRTVIFDFNRTLYNPETGSLLPGAKFALRTLVRRGFRLVLISRAGKDRKMLVKKLGLKPYFAKIIICRHKGLAVFQKIIKGGSSDSGSFVVGDRVRQEIALGNRLGLTTIWVREGKFAKELPRRRQEQPQFAVNQLRKILPIIR